MAHDTKPPASDVVLWINSPGGSVPSTLAIRNVMRLMPCDVGTLALGPACSAGQLLLWAGTRGERYALPHRRIVLHQPAARGQGTIPDLILQADEVLVRRSEPVLA